ncbi:hypothetical protein [Mycobacterium parmense]|uniref:Uncharacterized protein n=1 Tax=Mycobacterium parmense TaxID=185642 RepID=A0A7I7YPZ8_9MYCO|nr:hypothetical protein [Mycobacterium parmense]MCV7349636.1 hypothetical protein [Mycobacterium parmense]BBZ43719.1 hypothetical protein MPRM_10000 [Mycobacterium parmense]
MATQGFTIARQAAAAQQPAVLTGDVEAMPGRPVTPFARRVDNQRQLFNND